MHKLFIKRYSYILKKEIGIKSNKEINNIEYFIYDTLDNLAYFYKFGINFIGFVIFIFLKFNILKFELLLKVFSKVFFFKKYILFMKTLILISLNDI